MPVAKLRLTGSVLNPGDPGYEEALARVRAAREAREAQPKPETEEKGTTT
jgi:hypothetical protein